MEKILKILKRFTLFPLFLTVFIALPSFGLVIYALLYWKDKLFLSIMAYILSAYALIISCTAVYRVIRWSREGLWKHPMWLRYKRDIKLRMTLSLLPGLFINLLYVVIKLYSGMFFSLIGWCR